MGVTQRSIWGGADWITEMQDAYGGRQGNIRI